MKVCKNCGEINTNDCEYCCNCGQTGFIYQEEVSCPRCGASNDRSFVYCINCGSELRPAVPDSAIVNPARNAPQDLSHDAYTPSPVSLRDQMVDVYGGGLATSTPAETAQCPRCGALVPIHAIYCQKCGTPVDKLHEHRVVQRKICPHCGRPNSLEANFCSYCFCSLANADTEEMQLVHDTKNVGEDIVKQAYLEDERGKKKICTNCGTLNPQDEMFCVNCGFKLDVEEQKKYCPNCGAENPQRNAFCNKCQWSFDGSTPDTSERWICSNCYGENNSRNEFCVSCGAKRPTKGRKK